MFKILSAPTIEALELKAEEYDISSLGSVAISNGHFYLAILGTPKVKPKKVVKEEPAKEEPKKATPKKTTPKKRTTRKPKSP